MAIIMGVAALMALRGLKRGVQEATDTAETYRGDEPDAVYQTYQ